MSSTSYTSLSDHCNSVYGCRSVIHYAYRRLSHTVLSCIVSCVRTSGQDVWCWWPWLTCTDFWFI